MAKAIQTPWMRPEHQDAWISILTVEMGGELLYEYCTISAYEERRVRGRLHTISPDKWERGKEHVQARIQAALERLQKQCGGIVELEMVG